MIRIAFTLIGGQNWTGGYNYLLNLLRALAAHQRHAIAPVLFVPASADARQEAFAALPGVEVVESRLLDDARRKPLLLQALLWGRASGLADLFAAQRIDLVFEAAQFFGWRLPQPAIAWIPDFQHKVLPHFFTTAAWWKREIGFRAQILGGRTIMLSSEDARHACERHYPITKGRTHVVHFAVPSGATLDYAEARAVADGYGLPSDFIFLPNQFWRHKNHGLVLDALAILRDRGVDIVVAASGKQHDPRAPDYVPALKRTIGERGLEQSFRLLGLIPYAHLGALLRCCQAMLNPSLFEGWSTTVEEARSLAVPMVLSDLDVHREQMGAAARYFRRESAQSLADALQALPRFDRAQREADVAAARNDSEVRLRDFAADFARLAGNAMGRAPA